MYPTSEECTVKVKTCLVSVLCPEGWVRSPSSGTCIKLFFSKKNWLQARDFCKAEGGDLVKITDRVINDLVTSKNGYVL